MCPERSPVTRATPSAAPPGEDALRAGTWSLLGRLLGGPPDVGLLASLAAVDGDGASADAGGMAAEWLALRDAARTYEPSELHREYQQVFIGVSEGEVVPYASYYASGQLMDKPLVRLRQDLARLGFERDEGVFEPEDHAGMLCEIMAMVILDPDIPFAEQGPFFERHAAPWLGRFSTDLCKAPSARFYRTVGRFAERFIDVERQYLSMLA